MLLFKAKFEDGHEVHQTPEDKSLLIPPDENGNGPSAFYDVLNHPAQLERFSLGNRVLVDLVTGAITVDGFERAVKVVPKDGVREVVFFRKTTQSMTVTVEWFDEREKVIQAYGEKINQAVWTEDDANKAFVEWLKEHPVQYGDPECSYIVGWKAGEIEETISIQEA